MKLLVAILLATALYGCASPVKHSAVDKFDSPAHSGWRVGDHFRK